MSEPKPIPSWISVGTTVRHHLLPIDQPIAPAPRRTAVLAVHGMGQQKIFETVSQVVTSISDHCGARLGMIINARAVDTVVGEQKIGRVELELKDGGGASREVHVYESYWAPLTEGQVTLRDVVSFLFRAGLTGLRNIVRFRRTMFGGRWEYSILFGTPIALFIALLAVTSLVVVNSIMSGVLAANLTWLPRKWASDHVVNDLSAVSAVLAIFLLQLGVTLLLALHAKRFSPRWHVPRPVTYLIWTGSAILLIALVTSAALMADAVLDHRLEGTSFALAHLPSGTFDRIWNVTWKLAAFLAGVAGISALSKSAWVSRALFYVTTLGVPAVILAVLFMKPAPGVETASVARWFWVWALLWVVSWQARGFLVQFVGDVAVYVEPHRVDRFNALREKIRKTVFDTADAVYRACDADGAPLYDRVVIVAHSLGSVVAYDTLNALMRRDTAYGRHLQVVERTGALITFGSPLDKTAYLFSTQRASHLQHVQDALANTVQPLIQEGPRPAWVNIYSANDIISGRLDFYHVPGSPQVENVSDPHATIPLAAHVEYWENALLWTTLTRYL